MKFNTTNIQKALLKASFLGTFAEQLLAPIYLALVNRFGGGIEDAGFAFCIFQLSTGVFVLTFGKSEFFEKQKRWMLCLGFAILGVVDISYLLIGKKWEFYCLQMIAGVAMGLANPAWDSLYEDFDHEENASASKWSFWTGGIAIVQAAGAAVGGVVVAHYGLSPLFVLMAATDAFSLYYCFRVARQAGQE